MPELSIRPYQAEAIDFLVENRRACLYDDVGLGKSMQSLLAMRDMVEYGRILVITTGDAVGVWVDEARKWLGEEPEVVYGPGSTKADAFENVLDGLVVTTYARIPDALDRNRRWDGIIFDESQMLRNRNTETLFKTVRKNRSILDPKTPIFFLSATPVVKSAGDVWPMLHVVDRAAWSSYWDFVKKWAVVWEDQFGWHVEKVTNVTAMWQELSSVVMRRLRAEVQPDLPPVTRQRVPLSMTPKQAKAYRELENDLMTELPGRGPLLTPTVLAKEMRLRQLLVTPRLFGIDDDGAGLDAISQNLRSHERPAVIFTPFVEAFPLIEEALVRRTQRPMLFVKGGMGKKLHQSVEDFKTLSRDGLAPVLLAQVHMSKGWSVSEVTHECWMLGVDWNDITMVQAEGRLGRDGQTHGVISHYPTHEDTHDEDQLSILAGKRRLSDAILDRARIRGLKTARLAAG